ncbi:MFS transporter [Microlunatus sp. GCM10028923]|uniref:MFS transporter n=1 Tax=Microlunatus sp. GCM10028923 TaxID=3273400 RepID=UPI003624356F
MSTQHPQTAAPNLDQVPSSTRRRVLLAAGIGHFVEWFDFGLYGTLAATIAVLFFPDGDPQVKLLAAFAVFGAGFVMRPLGGLFWGPLGDKIGRKKVLASVVLMTSGATFLMGLLPTYHNVGVVATIALVLLRLVQGFAAGGESSGATTLLAEYAPPNRRGYFASWVDNFGFLAFVAGSGLVLLLTALLSEPAMAEWGWRLPFLLAGPLGLAGLYLRQRLEDTPEFTRLEQDGEVIESPLRQTFRRAWIPMLFCVGFVVLKAVGHWSLQTFMPSYLSTTLQFTKLQSYTITTITLLVIAILVPAMGLLSDRVGRRPMLITGAAGFLILAYPAFWLMGQGQFLPAAAAMIVLGIFLAIFDGAVSAAMAELFPTAVRYGGMAVAYNVSVAIFGGATPYFAAWLITSTGSNTSPAFFVMAAALITGVTVLFARETHRTALADVR